MTRSCLQSNKATGIVINVAIWESVVPLQPKDVVSRAGKYVAWLGS
jgi:hypothetical protein